MLLDLEMLLASLRAPECLCTNAHTAIWFQFGVQSLHVSQARRCKRTGGGDHSRDALSQQCCTLALCAENECPETCCMAKSCLVRLRRADASFRPRWQDIVLGHASTLTKAQRTPRALSA